MFTDLSEIFGKDMLEYCKNYKYCTTIAMVGCVPHFTQIYGTLSKLSSDGPVYVPDWFITKYNEREDYHDEYIKDNYQGYSRSWHLSHRARI